MRWVLILGVVVAVAAGVMLLARDTPKPPFPDTLPNDPFSPEALAASLARVRPHVEAVIGEPLGDDVRVLAVDATEWADLKAIGLARDMPEDWDPVGRRMGTPSLGRAWPYQRWQPRMPTLC